MLQRPAAALCWVNAARRLSLQPIKCTHVVRHVIQRERTPEGQIQRSPDERQEFQMHELVENEDEKDPGPLRVILLEDIEGIGLQFDVVEVNRRLARDNLLMNRRAVYASPFDLQYYSRVKERMKKELERRIRIPYDHIKLGRRLMQHVIPFFVSMNNPWRIDKELALASLRQSGIYLDSSTLFLPKEEFSGPNFDIEAKLFRFYAVVERQYVVPMLGRIFHCSPNDIKESITPERTKLPTEEQLKKHGLRSEDPYYHKSPELDETHDVFDLMRSR